MTTPWHEDALVSFSTVNVTTCVAYVIAGGLIVPQHRTLGLAMVGLGFASAVYHATRTMWGDRLDYGGMLLVFALLFATAVDWSPRVSLVIAVVLGVLPWIPVVWHAREQTVALLTGMTLGAIAPSLHTFVIAIALLAAGYTAWHLDVERLFPWPRWGHGVWHVATAAGLWWIAIHVS